ncbi:MAG: branched-chain amino acid ABC transporter permease [Candidatus Aminicenantes bacterium]|nr:MAG: branched-chain amino acid ABC transporter permease [Candidatus Aminicenantes bacterium]
MGRVFRASYAPLVLVFFFLMARYIFPNKMTFIIELAIFSIYVMGNNILYGYLGMVSFGQPFYLGVGAYATAIYLAHLGANPLIGMLCSLTAGLVVGLILGPAFIRLRGDYFALINAATCAIGMFTIEKLLLPITRGDDGLWYRSRMSQIPFLDIRMPDNFFIFALVIFLIVLILYNYMDKSTLGVSFRAIKVNESKMKFLGYDTFKIRWIGFSLASILSALAGSLYAINFGFVNPSLAEPHRAAEVLVATLIGGAGTVFGPFFGTLAFLGIKDLVSRYIAHWELAVGILTLLVLFRFSKGIWGNTEALINEKFGKKWFI